MNNKEIMKLYKEYNWEKCGYYTYKYRLKKWKSFSEAIEPRQLTSLLQFYREYEWEKCWLTTFKTRMYTKRMDKEEAIKPYITLEKRIEKFTIHPSLNRQNIIRRIHKNWDIQRACETPLWTRWGNNRKVKLSSD